MPRCHLRPRPLLRALLVLLVSGCGGGMSVRGAVTDWSSLSGMECVAVMPFADDAGEPSAGQVVAQAVASRLLTSERFNVVQPSDVQHLLTLFDVPRLGTLGPQAAQKLGEILGVQGVLIGEVTAFERRDLSARTKDNEAVVGFAARLVDARNGKVVWTASSSNFDNPRGLALPAPREEVLREAVVATTDELLSARADRVAARGLCATAYVSLQKGERPKLASLAELKSLSAVEPAQSAPPASASDAVMAGTLTAPPQPLADKSAPPPAPGLSSAPRAGAPGSASAGLPALPAEPPAAEGAGDGLPPLPADGSLPPLPPGEAGLPALPSSDGDGGSGELPALPALDGDAALPALPPSPAADGGDALPGLPEAPEPAAVPPPKGAPKKLLAQVKGKAKRLARSLYRKAPTRLTTVFPRGVKAKVKLLPRTRRSLDELGSILRAAPTMRVRLDVHVDLKGGDDESMRAIAQQQGELLRSYLHQRFGFGEDRVQLRAVGSAERQKKRGAPANNRVEVVVLSY